LSIQSYEYGANRTWATHGHPAETGAATETPRQRHSSGAVTKASHGYQSPVSLDLTPHRSPIMFTSSLPTRLPTAWTSALIPEPGEIGSAPAKDDVIVMVVVLSPSRKHG
jgi:hypothetical protein